MVAKKKTTSKPAVKKEEKFIVLTKPNTWENDVVVLLNKTDLDDDDDDGDCSCSGKCSCDGDNKLTSSDRRNAVGTKERVLTFLAQCMEEEDDMDTIRVFRVEEVKLKITPAVKGKATF